MTSTATVLPQDAPAVSLRPLVHILQSHPNREEAKKNCWPASRRILNGGAGETESEVQGRSPQVESGFLDPRLLTDEVSAVPGSPGAVRACRTCSCRPRYPDHGRKAGNLGACSPVSPGSAVHPRG